MKYGDHNIMFTLQQLPPWITYSKFCSHYESSIGFLKYSSTGLTIPQIKY